MKQSRTPTGAACVAALVLLASAPSVQASPASLLPAGVSQQPVPPAAAVQLEVTVIHATNDPDGGVDPRIGKVPNLGNYKSYKLLSRSSVAIKMGSSSTTTLPNQRTLQLSLKDVKGNQFIIDTSINQPGGTAFLPLLEVRAAVDVPVFIAGQTYQNGMLIIGIKVLPR
jgi:hypothetical protein